MRTSNWFIWVFKFKMFNCRCRTQMEHDLLHNVCPNIEKLHHWGRNGWLEEAEAAGQLTSNLLVGGKQWMRSTIYTEASHLKSKKEPGFFFFPLGNWQSPNKLGRKWKGGIFHICVILYVFLLNPDPLINLPAHLLWRLNPLVLSVHVLVSYRTKWYHS